MELERSGGRRAGVAPPEVSAASVGGVNMSTHSAGERARRLLTAIVMTHVTFAAERCAKPR